MDTFCYPHDRDGEQVAGQEQPQEDEHGIAQGIDLIMEEVVGQPGVNHPHGHGLLAKFGQDLFQPLRIVEMAE